jgi:putative transposase
MRTLNSAMSAEDFAAGMQTYYNYIRPHEALDGKTSAEACGIVVEGENKWKALIQNATKAKTA